MVQVYALGVVNVAACRAEVEARVIERDSIWGNLGLGLVPPSSPFAAEAVRLCNGVPVAAVGQAV